MSTYIIGDVHGCYRELRALLEQVNFSPKKDTLWLTGDLVSRGPESLQVLRYIKSIHSSVRLVLGNHDLHLLRVYCKISKNKPKDHLDELLNAYDIENLINWLRCQPLLQIDVKKKIIMAHAGITPQWDLDIACACAREVESVLSSDAYPFFINAIHGDMPNTWSGNLTRLSRLLFSTNALTRMRYCFPHGELDMVCKEIPKEAPSPLKPWFLLPNKLPEGFLIFFGHWSSLESDQIPKYVYGLDTGCCWGRELTLFHWECKKFYHQKSQQKCRKH
ncbi:Bis(5'-nucleosyl)-tetraphosphatase, symmetrical [Candidatus Hartigia pinicola]|nr:Bis(5'-nucleosyl)-tetraphosphatase, symmetrical [Candidatus Hartigia pinicola]